MSTRSEQSRTEDQRQSSARKRAAKKAPAAKSKGAKAGRVAAKAAYAYEAPRAGKPSRKSTRKSANRAKDVTFERRESLQKGTPKARARRAQAQGSRARGA